MGKEALIKNLISGVYLKTPRIIEAFRSIDRADFILPEYKSEAYENYPLPIPSGQTISQPLTVAFMLELLEPREGEKILDIGAGSGWQTALLAQIVGDKGVVVAVERINDLCEFAQKNIDKYGFLKSERVKFYCQDATTNLPDGPYDKIIAAAAASRDIPQIWKKNLKTGGKIVAPIAGSIWLFTKKGESQPASAGSYGEAQWEEKEFPGFAFVPLIRSQKSEIINQKPKRKINWIYFLATLGLLLVGGLAAVNEIYRPHASFKGYKTVEIHSGIGSRKIADLLKKEGVIRSKWAFEVYASLKGRTSSLKPGSYIFFEETIPEIIRDLVRGGSNERLLIIPEGWNVTDIINYLDQQGVTKKGELVKLVGRRAVDYGRPGEPPELANWRTKFDFLNDKSSRVGLEGYLFPDTYRVFKNAKAEDIVSKMLENFGKKLAPDLRAEITRQGKTIFEVVTMASMIEREVLSEEDRALVSGILWKRTAQNIGLRVDATISYIRRQDNNEKISLADTTIDSPYNTYRYRGLPLGPISNPGLSAIYAAIFPKESPYFYYLSTPEGKTIFSKTLEEHNIAKVKYLK